MAQKASGVLFGGEISGFTDKILEEIFSEVPKAKLLFTCVSRGLDLVKHCFLVGRFLQGGGKELISQGGFILIIKKLMTKVVTDS